MSTFCWKLHVQHLLQQAHIFAGRLTSAPAVTDRGENTASTNRKTQQNLDAHFKLCSDSNCQSINEMNAVKITGYLVNVLLRSVSDHAVSLLTLSEHFLLRPPCSSRVVWARLRPALKYRLRTNDYNISRIEAESTTFRQGIYSHIHVFYVTTFLESQHALLRLTVTVSVYSAPAAVWLPGKYRPWGNTAAHHLTENPLLPAGRGAGVETLLWIL